MQGVESVVAVDDGLPLLHSDWAPVELAVYWVWLVKRGCWGHTFRGAL